jgi:K+-transporting ATPase ATPase B chain
MDRLFQKNVIALSGRAIEAAGDVNVLLLDKTGTITFGNRMATEFIPAPMVTTDHLAEAAQLASLADETPEGRSIVVLAKDRFGLRAQSLTDSQARFLPFSTQTRMSGIDVLEPDGSVSLSIRKGAVDAIKSNPPGAIFRHSLANLSI